MSIATARRWVRKSSSWTTRLLVWTFLTVALVCGALVLSLRYWILPNIEQYREDIASAVSRAAKVRITIGRISAEWDGIRPQLKLQDVAVYDKAGRRALELERVESTLSWRSLATLRPNFRAIDIYRPVLDVRRDAKGVFSIAGIELEMDDPRGGGLSDWLLDQRDIEVHDAALTWTDEMRQAPPLKLSEVKLQVVNRGSRHRVGLRATPPGDLAGPIDVRADLRGDTVELLSDWTGRFFVQLDYANVPAFKSWVDIPFVITSGNGAVRAWLTFARHELTDAVADVRLTNVQTRLRDDLPQLDLKAVSGRLAWKTLPTGFEFSTLKLALSGQDAALQPADLLLRVVRDAKGVDDGELRANSVDLAPFIMLADRLPLDEDLRRDLVTLSPRGTVHDFIVRWNGAWPKPQQYSVRGRFDNLSLQRWEKLPGFSGLSGNIDGSEKGGTLHVTGQNSALDMPLVFGSPVPLDTLSAQVAWTRTSDRTEVRFTNVSFANPDAAGNVSGSFSTTQKGPGEVDLTGALVRAEARSVARYIPVNALKTVRPWLERSIIAGRSNDVRFKVKGRLEDFPFVQDKKGVFHVTAKVTGGTLDYAEKWPRVENLEGDLQFRGWRMEFTARQGTILGTRVSNVRGEVADMTSHPVLLAFSGEAEGPTSEFLSFIVKSPVSEMIGQFTEGMQAQGSGRLALKLALPLGQPADNKIAGTYDMTTNNLVIDKDIPPLEQATGRIEFTESAVRVTNMSATFLGGPIGISGSTQRDGAVRVALNGRVNADNVRRAGGPQWMQYLRGAADWRGTVTVRKKVPEIVIESNLQGIASSLPAPFGKAAADVVPLHVERRIVSAQQDRLLLTYGDFVKADLARKTDGKETIVERATIRLGPGEIGPLDKSGVWVRGSLRNFDADEWLAFAGRGEGGTSYTLAGADVKFVELDFFGRRFHDVAVTATPQGGGTQVNLAGRELDGTANWRGEGKGRLVGRFKKLTLPAADTKKPPPVEPQAAPGKSLDLPAIDFVAEQFQLGHKQLGRLELNAVPQDRDWRIEKLRIASAETVLTADGEWKGWLTQPRTFLNVRVETTDIGQGLARWALPPGIKGGTAKVEGQLSWAGSPQDFDTPTLGGQLVFDAAKGQFVKLEPGFGKLLGILSLQALPRRLSLDFRDVFSEGFAFDSILGSVKIDRGIATAENFRTQGPSARVVMSGQVDLARETQKLRVRVTPHLSDSVSIGASLLGGPIAGAAAFLAQKILKDPIEQFVSFEYAVTGTWSDPQVNKAERTGFGATETAK